MRNPRPNLLHSSSQPRNSRVYSKEISRHHSSTTATTTTTEEDEEEEAKPPYNYTVTLHRFWREILNKVPLEHLFLLFLWYRLHQQIPICNTQMPHQKWVREKKQFCADFSACVPRSNVGTNLSRDLSTLQVQPQQQQ